MEISLKNKRILVTGAGDGIGKELCKKLYEMQAKVIAVSRTAENLEKLKKETGDSLQTITVDLSNWKETEKALKDIGELDGLVNNAGVAIIKPIGEFTEEDFDRTIAVNLKAVFNVSQLLFPKIKDGGSIVNLSSVASSKSFAGHAVYSATKAAVDSLTKTFALELGSMNRKIRVNSVNPTVILTAMGRENWSDPGKAGPLIDKIPMKRFGEVKEVVEPIVFLLSDRSSFINGETILIEGGLSVQ